jgi:hypothetical protein
MTFANSPELVSVSELRCDMPFRAPARRPLLSKAAAHPHARIDEAAALRDALSCAETIALEPDLEIIA